MSNPPKFDSAPKLHPRSPVATPPKRVVVVRLGNDQYEVREEIFDPIPVTTRVLQKRVCRVAAEDEVRLWHENHIGFERFGDSGLLP